MSYAGPAKSATGASRSSTPSPGARPADRTGASRPTARRLPQTPGETDWQRVALFGVGVALGIAVGAGAALLTAPQSGSETRAALMARAGRLKRGTKRRSRDAWDELRDEIRGVKRSLRRRRARRNEERTLRDLDAEAAAE
jgi:gas vesicle protein